MTRSRSMLLAGALASVWMVDAQLAAAKADPPEQAEYAVRWEVKAGGPATVEEALKAMELTPPTEKPEAFVVEYYEVGKPADAPEGFDAILRRRTSDEAQLTFKYRGPTPLKRWRCPLDGHQDPTKQEADVSVVDASDPVPDYSYSCDVKGAQKLPHDLAPEPKGCKAKMERVAAPLAGERPKKSDDEIKVELWHIDETNVIEVSWGGKNDKDALDFFRKSVVNKLVAKGAKPSAEGMTKRTMNGCAKK